MTRRGSNNGRRLEDRRPAVTLTAAVDAANVMAAVEREAATMREAWAKCFPPVEDLNGAHIGNYYEARRKGRW